MRDAVPSNETRKDCFALGALIAISVLVRLAIIMTIRERASYDTPGFMLTANAIRTLDFSHYDGRRTPIYPLLLLLADMDWRVVRWIQCGLGVAIAAMMYRITWHRTRHASIAFIVGLLCSLAVTELFYEQIIYSEALCTFWIVLSMLALVRVESKVGSQSWNLALLGLSAALAGMTRPMFLYLGALYFLFILARSRSRVALALVLAPTLLLAFGWSAFNKMTIDYFGVTTTTGFNLSNHSGGFMELAPPRYAQIADIYLRYRQFQVQRMGSHTMTIWLAEDEIKRATGLTTPQLSKELTRMSLEMFAEHPMLYLVSVARAWMRFWGFGFFDFVRAYKHAAGKVGYLLLLALGSFQLAINLAFLTIAALAIARWIRGRIAFDFDLAIIMTVLAGSIAQAFMEYGENVRYLAPLVPLVIYTVASRLPFPSSPAES
ncbi:MAG TPA: hypothetical protein VKR29_09460 [Candidatus Binataceae bacterium]|nr:hypothetical protein [Candidatus Binataceae bacterium]